MDKLKQELYMISLDTFHEQLGSAMEKFALKSQVKKCTNTARAEVEDLSECIIIINFSSPSWKYFWLNLNELTLYFVAERFNDMDLEMERLRDKIEKATKSYNDHVSGNPTVRNFVCWMLSS